MKYQQLDNLESGWKWHYLVKKHQAGAAITCHLDQHAAEAAMTLLLQLEHHPAQVVQWIANHMNHDLDRQLKQSIRARRKRHFNAEQPDTRKKSIDLEFLAWTSLVGYAQQRQLTLSEAVMHLVTAAADKEQYASQMMAVKQDLTRLLTPSSP
jgi:macrodomain Ter protein organizer (MatP/YcbG family)